MIIVFKSKAYADILMFGDVAMRMMDLMGKIPDESGIITEEQLPRAIAGLREAMDADKANRAAAVAKEWEQRDKERDGDDDDKRDDRRRPAPEPAVSIGQRAAPLLELLERSLKRKVPVIWGKQQ